MRNLIATSAAMLLALPVASQMLPDGSIFNSNRVPVTASNSGGSNQPSAACLSFNMNPSNKTSGGQNGNANVVAVSFKTTTALVVEGATIRCTSAGAGVRSLELWACTAAGVPSKMITSVTGGVKCADSATVPLNTSGKFANKVTIAANTTVALATGIISGRPGWPCMARGQGKAQGHYWHPSNQHPSGAWRGPYASFAWYLQLDCVPAAPDLPANITNYGTPCGFEYDGKDAVSGQTHNLKFQATKLPANAPVVFVFGLKRTPPVALPIGKCSLESSLLTVVNGKADARGTAGFKGSTSNTKGVRFYSQAVALDLANNTLIASTGMSIDFTYAYDMGRELTAGVTLFSAASDNKVIQGLSYVFQKKVDADLLAYQAGIKQAAQMCGLAAKAFGAGSAAEKAALLKNPTYLQMVGIFGTAVAEGLRTIGGLQVLMAGGPKNAVAVRAGLNDMSNALTAAGFAGQQLMGIYATTKTMGPVAQYIGGMLLAAQGAAGKLTTWLNK